MSKRFSLVTFKRVDGAVKNRIVIIGGFLFDHQRASKVLDRVIDENAIVKTRPKEERVTLFKLPENKLQRDYFMEVASDPKQIVDREARWSKKVYLMTEVITPQVGQRYEEVIGVFKTLKTLDEIKIENSKKYQMIVKNVDPVYFQCDRTESDTSDLFEE